jgi:sterol carrier protein 2
MTDTLSFYSGGSMNLVGFEMTRRAAQTALAEARVSPRDTKSANYTTASLQMS